MSWITEAGGPVVGLAGLAFAWAQSRGGREHERTLADLAATRDVLEAGAIHLHRAAYAMDRIKTDLIGGAASAQASLLPLGVEYDVISERIKVRLGREHAVTVAYVVAGEAFLEVWRAVDRVVVLHLPHLDGEGRGGAQTMDHIEEERTLVTAQRAIFDARRVEFIDAAVRTAGAHLPTR